MFSIMLAPGGNKTLSYWSLAQISVCHNQPALFSAHLINIAIVIVITNKEAKNFFKMSIGVSTSKFPDSINGSKVMAKNIWGSQIDKFCLVAESALG